MEQIAGAEPPVPASAGGIVYVVDAASTLETQQLMLEIRTSRKRRDGTWGKLYRAYVDRDALASFPDPADRKILSLIAGATLGGSWTKYYHPFTSSAVPVDCAVPEAAAGVLLPLLCATGRCLLRVDPESETGEPLAWNGEPWEVWLEVREEAAGDCLVTGSLRRGQERLPPGMSALFLRPGLVFASGQVSRLESESAFRWIPLLCPGGALRAPAAEREDLLERLLSSPDLPRFDLPESMQIEEMRTPPRPRLRLRPPRGAPQQWLFADLSFLYGGHEVAFRSRAAGSTNGRSGDSCCATPRPRSGAPAA
jgi:hypothetical protein